MAVSLVSVSQVHFNEVCVAEGVAGGLPCVWAFALHRSQSTGAAAVSFSKCVDDTESCASGVEQMVETAWTVTQEVHHELNATRKRFDKILKEFVGCNSLTSQVKPYRSSFATKVRSHTQCRQQQKGDHDVTQMCKKLLRAAETNRTLLCERDSLTGATTDLVPLCKPAVKQSLGMWLEDLAELVNIRYMKWKEDYAACPTQKWRFVRRQPNAALPKAPSHNRHSCAEEISTAWSPSRVLGQLDLELGAPRKRVVLHPL